jgi:hypothetical protein
MSRGQAYEWLQQGLAELAGRVLQREEELSLKHDQSSPVLELFGSEPAPVLIEQQPSTVELMKLRLKPTSKSVGVS